MLWPQDIQLHSVNVPAGIFYSGSPNSMNMLCPDSIGRDSWEWEGQESVEWPDLNFPQDLGEEALTEGFCNTKKNGASPG